MTIISKYFEQQVERTPSNVAIEDASTSLTYDELNDLANNIALHLTEKGIGEADRVVLCLNRSLNTIATMIAVNKIGACYIPVSPDFPDSVLTFQVQASDASLAVTSRTRGWTLPKGSIRTVDLDDLANSIKPGKAIVEPRGSEESPMYIMYTSGSTGDPKGVVIPQRAVRRLAVNPNFIETQSADVFLAHSPLTFDASTFEIWSPLVNGARLVVYELEGFDPNELARCVTEQGVTVLWLTSALFHFVANNLPAVLSQLRILLAGGDVLNPRVINKVLDQFPDLVVINGYGPTENTTFTCCHIMTANNRPSETVPIGHPISGTTIQVLGADGNRIPEGESGELVVSGEGVALGYLNTGAKSDQFFTDSQSNWSYRTGDIVRWRRPHGLEFLGRNDRLVKIRGHRISLDEVENLIDQIDHVDECVMQVTTDREERKYLTALIQTKGAQRLPENYFRKKMRECMPDHMVPDKVIFYAEFPINQNGKIDRKSIQPA